jgi:hypothetical protein
LPYSVSASVFVSAGLQQQLASQAAGGKASRARQQQQQAGAADAAAQPRAGPHHDSGDTPAAAAAVAAAAVTVGCWGERKMGRYQIGFWFQAGLDSAPAACQVERYVQWQCWCCDCSRGHISGAFFKFTYDSSSSSRLEQHSHGEGQATTVVTHPAAAAAKGCWGCSDKDDMGLLVGLSPATAARHLYCRQCSRCTVQWRCLDCAMLRWLSCVAACMHGR